jgi:hypothetical protein
MTKKERWRLLAENASLRATLRSARQRNKSLSDANANLRVERDAADVLLGEAMDELLDRSKP